MDNFKIKALREIVKENKEDVVERSKNKFKEIRVEEKRKSYNSSSTMFTESLPSTYFTEAEQKEIEAKYIGTESKARKRSQGTRSFSQQRVQSQDRRQEYFSRPKYNPRYDGFGNRSRYDRFKSPGWKEKPGQRDQSQTQSRPPYSPRCIGCKCESYYKNKKTLDEIKELIRKKLDI